MRTRYTATATGLCECCDEGVKRGMPIVYVAPFTQWRNAHKRSVAIHARCEHAYDLQAEGEALCQRTTTRG